MSFSALCWCVGWLLSTSVIPLPKAVLLPETNKSRKASSEKFCFRNALIFCIEEAFTCAEAGMLSEVCNADLLEDLVKSDTYLGQIYE